MNEITFVVMYKVAIVSFYMRVVVTPCIYDKMWRL